MKENKNIDQLFKAKFQDFEATPSPAVWEGIESKLQAKKKSRKVIPIWWRVAGVAALLALLFTIGVSVYNTDGPSNEFVVEDPIKNVVDPIQNEENDGKIDNQNTTVASETNDETNGIETNNGIAPENSKANSVSASQQITGINNVDNTVAETNGKQPKTDSQNVNKTNLKKTSETQIFNSYNTKKEAVAANANPKSGTNKKTETTFNPLVKDDKKVVSETVGVAEIDNTTKNSNTTDQKITPPEATDATETEIATNTTTEENKKSIFDAIDEQKKLEETVAQKEGPSNRWAIAPNVGPVYYGSLSGGSSLDPMFADNNQSGDVNLSYGVQVAYDLSDKLSVRSGFNNVNLSYATGEVQVATAPESFALESISYNNRGAVTTVFDRGSLPTAENNSGGFGDIIPKSTGGNAEISQQLSYYEVPLELKYDLLDNRFGVNVIGGMSTLFLGNNEVVVTDGDFRTVLGEANNLNSISFTTNIGLGFNYQLSKKLKFNIEPMFKYQLNPYTDTSVDFRPYYLGVYSGLSFKF